MAKHIEYNADYDISNELYKVSGWKTGRKWVPDIMNNGFFIADGDPIAEGACPVYNAGFLLRKCKSEGGIIAHSESFTARRPAQYGAFPVGYKDPLHGRIGWDDEKPENALCIMYIELFKVRIMTKEK